VVSECSVVGKYSVAGKSRASVVGKSPTLHVH